MNIIKKMFHRPTREEKKLKELLRVFATIDKLYQSNMVYWDRANNRVFIAEPIATVMLERGEEKWSSMLNNLYFHHVYDIYRRRADDYISAAQAKAVLDARQQNPALSDFEVQCIRRGVNAQIKDDVLPEEPIKPFDFFIVADVVGSAPVTTLAGQYNPDTQLFTIVPWGEIQAAMEQRKREQG